ncbi:hypothetical protein O6H91_17G030000 [Diphasiastrum complanatum]|uniref:Uncharacterized protein n=1 Tax=Diphasiastrum complanatum TaxID=34168 RepID=A0ACC2B5E8_DIPCM|nr:hypothetical protein O6H91_17G030000 [Diphasiastrum complanatum]
MGCCQVMSLLDIFPISLEFISVYLTRTLQSVHTREYALEREGLFMSSYMANSPKSESTKSPQCPSRSSSSRNDQQSLTICNAELSTCGTSAKPCGLNTQLDPSLESGAALASFEKPRLKNECGFSIPSLENSRNEGAHYTADAGHHLGNSSLPPVKRARISQFNQPDYAPDALLRESFAFDGASKSQFLATPGTEPGTRHPKDKSKTSFGSTWWLVPKTPIPQSRQQEARQGSAVEPSNSSENNGSCSGTKEIDFMFRRPTQNREVLSVQKNDIRMAAVASSITSQAKSARSFSQDGGELQSFSHKDLAHQWLNSSALVGEQTVSKTDSEQNRESSVLKLGRVLGHTQSLDTSRRSFVQWRPSVSDVSSRALDGTLPQVSPVQGWNQQRTLQVTQVTSGTSFAMGRLGQATVNTNELFPGILPARGFVPFYLPEIGVPTAAFEGIQSHLVSQGQRVHVPEPKALIPLVSEGFKPHISRELSLSGGITNAHQAFASITHDYESKISFSAGHINAPPGLSSLRPAAEQAPVFGQDVLPSVMVVMEGQSGLGRICLQEHCGYRSFAQAIRMMFENNILAGDPCLLGGECDLKNAVPGHRIAYEDDEGDLLLVGDLPWREFVHSARRIRVVPLRARGKQ